MEKPFPAYSGDASYVFVCYAHDDDEVVYPEIGWLHEQGIKLWYDEGVSAGERWRKEIGNAISGASRVLCYLSSSSLRSDHCDREISFALNHDIPIVPVYLEEVELSVEVELGLGNVQAIHRTGDEGYKARLLRALGQTVEIAQAEPGRDDKRHRGRIAAAALGMALLVGIGWWSWEQWAGVSKPAQNVLAIAVAPFASIGDEDEVLQFAEAATVDVRDAIAGTDIPLVDVGGADYILEGRVRKSDHGLQITTEFRRASDGRTIWSDQLEEDATQASPTFARAPYIARRVEGLITYIIYVDSTTTTSQAARDAFLDALVESENAQLGAGGSYPVAFSHIESAIAHDPMYVDAVDRLVTWYWSGAGGTLTKKEATSNAHQAVERLLAINPDWTYMLGAVNRDMDLDYASALRNLDHSEWTNRKNQVYDTWVGGNKWNICTTHFVRGDLDEASRNCDIAFKRGFGVYRNAALWTQALIEFSLGHYKEVIRLLDEHRNATGQDNLRVLIYSAKASLYLEDYTRANLILDSAWEQFGEAFPEVFSGVFALVGRKEKAEALLDDAESRFENGTIFRPGDSFVWNFQFGENFFASYHLGDFDDAFVWLNRAIENRDASFIGILRSAPQIEDGFRDDERFTDAMQRLTEIEAMGSPTTSVATECYKERDADSSQLVSCVRLSGSTN